MPKTTKSRNRLLAVFAIIPILILSLQAFGQSSNSALSGTVQDSTESVLPGATVTAKNTQTNVVSSTLTNNSGVYNFNLQPGIYTVSAELEGFQTAEKTDVRLGSSGQIRLDFELNVAGITEEIVIKTTAQDQLLESSSSTGTVLESQTVTELPLASNDVMDLINIMGGVVKSEDPIFRNNQQTFAGVEAQNINIQRDGITVNDLHYDSGIISPQRINQEMVGEFKLILSPVDAEMGRGAGQVQIMTKSGANDFHGSAVWNVQNTVLDANEWGYNRSGIEPNWRNLNNYILTASGPIIKNRTFFFVSWDHNIAVTKSQVNVPVLTPCARKGIFRYFDGWDNGSVYAATTRSSGTQTRAVVDENGNPLIPADDFDNEGEPYTGAGNVPGIQGLNVYSVLGELTPAAMQDILADPINCSAYDFSMADQGIVPDTAWDEYRTEYDATGFVDRFTGIMPPANDWTIGDGLNVAGHRWNRAIRGSDTVYGNGEDNQRKAITIKIDHNLNDKHRLGGRYTYESDNGLNDWPLWPNGYGGALVRKPQSFSINLTSTIKPTLLNEFRTGLSRTSTIRSDALSDPITGDQMRELMDYLMPTESFPNYSGFPLLVGPGRGYFTFRTDTYGDGTLGSSHPFGSRGNLPTARGGKDPRWTFADTLTWVRGTHSFKGGVELRLQRSEQFATGAALFTDSANTFPSVEGGNTPNSQPSGIGEWPGIIGDDNGNSSSGNVGNAYDLMTYMAGSVGYVRQWFYNAGSEEPYRWNDSSAGELSQDFDIRNREFAFFFKDDWKATKSLTLNLGIRYEYYGVPWVNSGQTAALVGGPSSIFGVSGDSFNEWMPVAPVQGDDSMLTRQQFVGPNSPNPDLSIYNKDLNNWGPAIGFAYQIPWFGKGKTTLRGGYQLTYSQLGHFDDFARLMANVTGTTYTFYYNGDSADHPYLDMTDLPDIVPIDQYLPEGVTPLSERPITERTQTLTAWDENIVNPYTQSLTMSLTRNIGSNLTVDIRYIGTLGRKLPSTINLNQPNFMNNGLRDAFDIAREGGQSPLLNSLIQPGSLTGSPTATGSDQLRTSSFTRQYLATGDYRSLADTLARTNGRLPYSPGTSGEVLRQGFLPDGSPVPENFIYANPQFRSANFFTNIRHSNYHSMQAQVTLRPTRGLNFTTTYTWSRGLASYGSITDYRDWTLDYGLTGSHRSHALTSYGAYTLPFGTNGFFFRDITGIQKHLLEGWNLSWIYSATSGIPDTIDGMNRLWANGLIDLVGDFDTKSGQVTWEPGADAGYYFGEGKYVQVPDPQCENVWADFRWRCENYVKAYADADTGEIIFQHPLPGERGNFPLNSITGPGRWTLDMALGKTVEFMEGKRISFRVDAQNILNHPTPSNSYYVRNPRFTILYNPEFSLNDTREPLGYISAKGGHRTFQAKLRISF